MAKSKTPLESAEEKLTEEEYEALSTRNYEQGRVVGRGEGKRKAVQAIRVMASEAFMASNDDKAGLLRDLAAMIEKLD